MPFTYEAVDSSGNEVQSVIDVESADEAMAALHARGLFVTQVAEVQETKTARTERRGSPLAGRAGNARDRMLFTQQMSMMLHAGSQVVPALTAIEAQVDKAGWRKIIHEVCHRVQDGAPLSEAMADYPQVFDETFRAILAAGESTGKTADAFDRLAAMTKTQQEIKVKVVGAMIYPIILILLSIAVVSVLMFYVLPKFDALYATLGTELPGITTFMISVSRVMAEHWPVFAGLAIGVVVAGVLATRLPAVRAVFDRCISSLPLVSSVVHRVILAKIFRVWGTLVRSNVPLLDGLHLCRSSTRNVRFLQMLDNVIESLEQGDTVGETLSREPLVPPTMAAAIATGEQSGQLGQSLLYLADYLDEENGETIGTLTRLVEPFILIVMGAVVGLIAIALFLPLFDLTAAASGGR